MACGFVLHNEYVEALVLPILWGGVLRKTPFQLLCIHDLAEATLSNPVKRFDKGPYNPALGFVHLDLR